ncbi:MAG: hypothetical protein P1Q69_13810 [Candidatus Thorarchaeota archaeon]|nr:hypothetical protein [Candidatus Thorarchaeota archaeon]
MAHCELWLEMKRYEKSFRVALLVPDDFEVPEEYTRCEGYQHPSKKRFFKTEWFSGIKGAKDKMNETAEFYSKKDAKFLFFREIREPLC